ncbi:cytochrome c oxidase subunit 3 [Photobacterium galatheae]|uniref:Cytochrome oxidase subunit III n=1 Tax=Photobacterium galatheae TaxID=1654360 RepID=A0A066RHG7_9GAMM|nr:cytochrome c oxidase subunit 3 [Photobacterium galatheae]KDM89739.1 cytochrome oxidase subunit III [Photobacterium galatheae]MCM0150363.1 cytochrome c oxidase subunit 3 [Photobacterium galatheae]
MSRSKSACSTLASGQLSPDPNARYQPASPFAAVSTGLWILLGVIGALFALFTLAYYIRYEVNDWQPLNEPWQLLLSTTLLVLSCLTLHFATRHARLLPSLTACRTELLLTVGFTAGFILAQLWAWQALISINQGVQTNPANSFFFLLTGLHAIHVAGGVIALTIVVYQVWRGHRDNLHLWLNLCARYWHFLLFIWLFLLGLLRLT